jgi:hypothetical protein
VALDFAAYFRKPLPIEELCRTAAGLIQETRTPPD